jgi:hypothetical protein
VSALARLQRAWPPLLLASAAAASVVAFAGPSSPARLPVVLWFLLVCPGMALVRLLRVGDAIAEIAIGVALSAALVTLVAGTMLYAGAWSPNGTLAILVGLTVIAAAVDMRRGSRSVHQEER